MIVTLKAAISYAHRFADLAAEQADMCQDPKRKKELLDIAQNCRRVPEYPATTFYEAIQFVWFIHLIYQIENVGHNHGFGRFDQYMYPYFKADLEKGTISEEKCVELIQEFFIKITEIFELRDNHESTAYAGYPMWNTLCVGGIDKYGKNACNRLSYLILEASESGEISQPSISFRYNRKNSPEVTRKALLITQKGLGQPAFFNDDLNIPRVLANGATVKDARNYVPSGCVEIFPPGKTDCRGTVGFVNLLKILDLVLHNGWDPMTNQQLGIQTGTPEELIDMDKFKEAYKKQLAYFIGIQLKSYNIVTGLHSQILPSIFVSALVDGCIDTGKVLQKGGAKYNYSNNFPTGLANTADSLAVIDQIIYQEKKMTLQDLINILDNNYEGKENLRQMMINRVPKYGNNVEFVDEYAHFIVDFFSEEVEKYTDSRGSKYTMVIQSQIYNIWQGRAVGATPDGRRKGEPMADNASPTAGYDTNGPTAAVCSVANIDEMMAHHGVLLNQKFDPAIVRGEKGLEILHALIKGYFAEGGQHIQINVVDEETLRAAQQCPQKYQNLMVRVAGYSAYFIDLDPEVQENIIERTTQRSL